ncbi:MAG: DNA polymerase subunit beta [Methanobacterium sp.]|uniref:DNA polymerase subunit beta n=1 Tax=Methanobacterium sp. TaxID=2164 RepID=UPI003D65B485|nr:DNA polymerase subunit beta [Methanobacterium sp.]
MRARTRDFIYTKDDLFFATTSYLHPEGKILAFLRYIPDQNGERSKNGKRYSKVDSNQAYDFLSSKYTEYLFDLDKKDLKMMGVPFNKVEKILKPEERLKEIMEDFNNNELFKKAVKLADIFHNHADIPYSKMGVSGSILPGLYDQNVSDIDFVIYGLKNHKKAMDTFGEIKDKSDLKSISDEYWVRLYQKRIKDSSLSYEEFQWYEQRKNNRGVIDGVLFDILATRDWDEIKGKYGEEEFEHLGQALIECTVSDAIGAFDNPAVYKIEDLNILEGLKVPITEIASFTHTYSGQAKDNEEIIAKGRLEKVIGPDTRYRLVVGTTRESIDEYIKLTKFSILSR